MLGTFAENSGTEKARVSILQFTFGCSISVPKYLGSLNSVTVGETATSVSRTGLDTSGPLKLCEVIS